MKLKRVWRSAKAFIGFLAIGMASVFVIAVCSLVPSPWPVLLGLVVSGYVARLLADEQEAAVLDK
jgi:hypothetical protein